MELRFGDRLAAAEYYLRSGNTLHAWMRAYSPEFAKFGPGHLLFWEAAQHAARDGVTRIDWGSGDDAFKSKFASGSFAVYSGWADYSRLRSRIRRSASHIAYKLKLTKWIKRLYTLQKG